MSRVDERHKYFATIVYEDSAPENWMNIIEQWNCEHHMSPRHDKGVKPHWHIMLCFNEIKTDKEVGELFSRINGIGLVHVESSRAMMRYLRM